MSRKLTVVWIVAWIAVAALSFFPLILSIGNIEAQHQEVSWLGKAALMFKGSSPFQVPEPYLIWVLFGLLIVAFILRVLFGNKKLQAMRELYVTHQITTLLTKGESQVVTFLPRLLGADRQQSSYSSPELLIVKNIAGLMNTHGGYLFIGVNKEGTCSGLEEDYQEFGKPHQKHFHQYLVKAVQDMLDPSCCLLLKVNFYTINGKDICRVQVKRSPSPVYVHVGDRAHFYIRAEKRILELDVREVLEYIEKVFC